MSWLDTASKRQIRAVLRAVRKVEGSGLETDLEVIQELQSTVHWCGFIRLWFPYLREQWPEICEMAVREDGLLLKHVKEQTQRICVAAVCSHGEALQYVKEQTMAIILIAIFNPRAMIYIRDKQAWEAWHRGPTVSRDRRSAGQLVRREKERCQGK